MPSAMAIPLGQEQTVSEQVKSCSFNVKPQLHEAHLKS